MRTRPRRSTRWSAGAVRLLEASSFHAFDRLNNFHQPVRKESGLKGVYNQWRLWQQIAVSLASSSSKGTTIYHRLLAMLEWSNGESNMTVEQAIDDISALPPKDQLRIVQAIWDRLADGIGTELSDSQHAELDRRWAKYKSDPTTAVSEEEFRERIHVARGR